VRTVLVATAVGATAGGGVVSAFVDHSAEDQRSVADRTLVKLIPAAPISVDAAQTAQQGPQTSDQSEAMQALGADGHVKKPAANELNASSRARPTIVAASHQVHVASGGDSAKTAVAPSPTLQVRQKHIARRARRKDVPNSSRRSQHSLPARIEPDAFQRFLAGLTAAVGQVWPLATSTAAPASRAHGNGASATAT
jgi:hypothetical protein